MFQKTSMNILVNSLS